MDPEVIEQKLESLRHCLQRIQTKCPTDAQILATDADLQDIVALNLIRARSSERGHRRAHHLNHGRAAARHVGQTFDLLAQAGVLAPELASSLKRAVGFRNIAVHSYETINWRIVHSIAKNHLVDFSEFAKVVVNKCL